MIPLSDSQKPKSFPWATWALAAGMVGVFVREFTLGDRIPAFLDRWAFHPAALAAMSTGDPRSLWPLVTLLSALFLHAGLLHLAGNLAFLVVFGDDVEGRLGGWRYLALFLASGAAASLAQAAASPHRQGAIVGASGAIAGILGCFLVLFPRARIGGVLPLGCLILPAKSRAFLFLPVWFAIQLVSALLQPAGQGAGVAWYAHLAGFAVGPVLYFLLRRR
ncbi:MAG: rhomboid family intramembrane serine protease [Thermoanaerobaculia bacterium]